MKAQPPIARRIGVGLLAVCATVLTSCAAGEYAQTAYQTPAIDGLAKARIGSLELRGVAVLTPPNSIAYAPGDDARVTLAIVNTGTTDDTLTGVSSPAADGYTITTEAAAGTPGSSQSASSSGASSESSSSSGASSESASSSASGSASSSGSASGSASASSSGGAQGSQSIAVPAGQSVGFDTPGGEDVLILTGLKNKLYPGTSISVTFTFQKSGAITVTVPVQLTEMAPGSTIPAPSSGSEG